MNWQKDSLIQSLKELVEIPSGTENVAGVYKVQARVVQWLKELGFHCEFISPDSSEAGERRFLVATKGNSGPYVDFVTHADTVFEKDSGFLDFKIDTASHTATGPGVIDDKGGILVALSGIAQFLEKTRHSIPLRFLCAPSEEIGSPGFQNLLQKLGANSRLVLGFEPSLEDGSIVESRRGNRWYEIHVHGKEAHAGRDPHRGVNAAVELSQKLVALHELNGLFGDVTVSPGAISGGRKFNIVCGQAQAKVDVRFSQFKTRDEVQKRVDAILQTPYLAPNSQGEIPKTDYRLANDCPPFSRSPLSVPYLEKYLEILETVEHKSFSSVTAGGAADANYMSRPDLPILDGLGATGGGMHRTDEFIRLNSLETRSLALSKFLESLEK